MYSDVGGQWRCWDEGVCAVGGDEEGMGDMTGGAEDRREHVELPSALSSSVDRERFGHCSPLLRRGGVYAQEWKRGVSVWLLCTALARWPPEQPQWSCEVAAWAPQSDAAGAELCRTFAVAETGPKPSNGVARGLLGIADGAHPWPSTAHRSCDNADGGGRTAALTPMMATDGDSTTEAGAPSCSSLHPAL